MKQVQLTLDGGETAPLGKTKRDGLIGKVHAALEEAPWLTASEMAKRLGEKAAPVAAALYALKKEGLAQRESGIGPRGGWAWASTSDEGRDARQIALQARQCERVEKRGLAVVMPDWRPDETIPEDYYAT